jgi:hypothetical protein
MFSKRNSSLKHERLPKLDSLFAIFGVRCWNLVLVEFDVVQHALELFARVEAG